jgi:hypothetical protein
LQDVPVSAQQQTLSAPGQVATRRALATRISAGLEENGLPVVAVAAFAVALVTHIRTTLDTDGWMALLTGRVVAQHGLPSHDTLTVWAHGRNWVDQQWLAQRMLYGLYQLGGLKLVLLVHIALVVLAIAGAATLARRLGGSPRSVTWIALPVFPALWPEAAVMRPQTFAYVLFVAVLWLLLEELRSPSRRVYFVLPLLVLWANLHGSVVVGAALVSAFAVCEIAGSVWKSPRSLRLRSLALLAAPWPCVLASPYATSLPHYYHVIFSSKFGTYVTEWGPTTLALQQLPVYVLILAGFWLLGRAGDRTSAFEKLAFVGLSFLAFDAIRNCVWLALLALVVLPRLLDALRAPAVEPKRLNRLLAITMVFGVLVATLAVALKPKVWITQNFPAATANAAASAAGTNGRIFANERFADWLVFEHPKLAGRIAFDSRFELLTSSQLRSVAAFRDGLGNWRSTVRGYGVFVLDRQDDAHAIHALLTARLARVVKQQGPIVVLRRH